MGGVSRTELKRREGLVLSACGDQLVSRPHAGISAASIGAATGLDHWQARRIIARVARSREHFLQRGALHLADEIVARATRASRVEASVVETLDSTIGSVADALIALPGRAMIGLVIHQGRFESWIADLYEERIRSPLAQYVERRVEAAGAPLGIAIFLEEGAARDAIRKVEEAALLALLDPACEADDRRQKLVREVARGAMLRTRAWSVDRAA